MPKDLRSYLRDLREKRPNDIKVVDREVDPICEATALLEKLQRQGEYPLVIFRKVKGSDLPLVINLGASYDRIAIALGSDNVRDMQKDLATREMKPIPPVEIPKEEAPVKEVIWTGDDVDLEKLPILQHNEFDAGRYIDAAPCMVRQRGTGVYNIGLYRHQLQGKNQLGYMVNPANHGHYIRAEYEEAGEPTPVVLVLGHHPAFIIGAVSRQPGVGGELEAVGAFLGEPVRVVKAETVDMMVPADAEIIIEGYIPPNERHHEGPFGEWPHYYYKVGPQPFIRVTAITMRKDAIYQSIFNAHAEHNIIGAVPRLGSLYRRVKGVVPGVTAINLPLSGGGRSFCYISLKKRSEGEPKLAAMAAMVAEPNIKHAIVVDDDIDVFNEENVLWALAMRFRADRDLAIIPHALGAHLNPTAYGYNLLEQGPMETKLIFDATKPLPPYEFPKEAKAPEEMVERIEPADYIRDLRDGELESLSRQLAGARA